MIEVLSFSLQFSHVLFMAYVVFVKLLFIVIFLLKYLSFCFQFTCKMRVCKGGYGQSQELLLPDFSLGYGYTDSTFNKGL